MTDRYMPKASEVNGQIMIDVGPDYNDVYLLDTVQAVELARDLHGIITRQLLEDEAR